MPAQVLIFVESRYQVNRKRIKRTIDRTLSENKMITPVEVSVAIVGDRKMKGLNKKYRNLDKTTNVLSFPISEGEVPALPPSNRLRLGDIVLSFPQVIRDAARDEVLVDEKVDELVAHGLLHLLGIHH
jgi:probable rRNA maturation factor